MPLYNVEHSFPLNVQQKQDLAERITRLHGTAFATLSVFVQVKFYQQDASAQNHYVGGVPQEQASNRITAFVRSSSSRSQEDFDKLAKKVEDAWYIVLGLKSDEDEEDEKDKKDKNDKKEVSATEKAAKELLSVVYIGGLSGREKGFEIPVVCLISEDAVESRFPIQNANNLIHRLARSHHGSSKTVMSLRNERILVTRV